MSFVPLDGSITDPQIAAAWKRARRHALSASPLSQKLADAIVADLEAAGVTEADVDRAMSKDDPDVDDVRRELDAEETAAREAVARKPHRRAKVWARTRTGSVDGRTAPWSKPVDDLPGNGRTGALKGPYYLRGNEYETQDKVAKVIGISQGKLSELLNKGFSPDSIFDQVEAGQIPKKRVYRRRGGFKL